MEDDSTIKRYGHDIQQSGSNCSTEKVGIANPTSLGYKQLHDAAMNFDLLLFVNVPIT